MTVPMKLENGGGRLNWAARLRGVDPITFSSMKRPSADDTNSG